MTGEVVIIPAITVEHARAIYDLRAEWHPYYGEPEHLHSDIASDDTHALVAYMDGAPVGFTEQSRHAGGWLLAYVNEPHDPSRSLGTFTSWLSWIYVSEAHRGNGIGAALLTRTLVEARRFGALMIALHPDGSDDSDPQHLARRVKFFTRHGFHWSPRAGWRGEGPWLMYRRLGAHEEAGACAGQVITERPRTPRRRTT